MFLAAGRRLHRPQPGVVVGDLLQVRPGDLAGHQLVVVGHVRLGIVGTVLQLDDEADQELAGVKRRVRPIDADPLADRAGVLDREVLRGVWHGASLSARSSLNGGRPTSGPALTRPAGFPVPTGVLYD